MIQRFHIRMVLGLFLSAAALVVGTNIAAVVGSDVVFTSAFGLKAAGIGTGMACCEWLGDDDWALKAAAMAMAPLIPVPATRQITVEYRCGLAGVK